MMITKFCEDCKHENNKYYEHPCNYCIQLIHMPFDKVKKEHDNFEKKENDSK